jgi:fused signal recognition particle receptor
MFDFLKKLFKGDESKKTDSKPVKKTTKPKAEPKKSTVAKSKTVKKESNKKTKPKK